jgi:hypothetical protein
MNRIANDHRYTSKETGLRPLGYSSEGIFQEFAHASCGLALGRRGAFPEAEAVPVPMIEPGASSVIACARACIHPQPADAERCPQNTWLISSARQNGDAVLR